MVIKMNLKFIRTFLLDLTFFVFTIIILILGRLKLMQMLVGLQGYGPQLNSIDPNANILQTQNLLSQINTSADKIYIYLFIILPLIIFILYILIQGFSFYLLKKQKNFFIKFILSSLVPIIILVLAISQYNYILLVLFFISSYLAFFLYFKDLKEIKLAYKKIYVYFPYYLVYLILSLLILSSFFMTDASYKISNLFFWYLTFGILFTGFFSLYKIYLVKKLS